MRIGFKIIALGLSLFGINVDAAEDKCPKNEYACFDVINSSLCLSQNAARGTKEQLAKCVDYPGGMSDLPGATKLCRCPGCHSASINAAIERLFPPPCG